MRENPALTCAGRRTYGLKGELSPDACPRGRQDDAPKPKNKKNKPLDPVLAGLEHLVADDGAARKGKQKGRLRATPDDIENQLKTM